jgi:hypothetical protein
LILTSRWQRASKLIFFPMHNLQYFFRLGVWIF